MQEEYLAHRWVPASTVFGFIAALKERLDNRTLRNSAELREIAESFFIKKKGE